MLAENQLGTDADNGYWNQEIRGSAGSVIDFHVNGTGYAS